MRRQLKIMSSKGEAKHRSLTLPPTNDAYFFFPRRMKAAKLRPALRTQTYSGSVVHNHWLQTILRPSLNADKATVVDGNFKHVYIFISVVGVSNFLAVAQITSNLRDLGKTTADPTDDFGGCFDVVETFHEENFRNLHMVDNQV